MAAHSGGSQTDSERDEVLDLLPPDLEDVEVVRFRFGSSGPSSGAAAAAGVAAEAAGIATPGFQSTPVAALN